MDTTLTTTEINLAIYNSGIWDTRTHIFVPNISFGLLNYEADLVILNKTGYLTEIEIKRSFEDLKADFKKDHKHDDEKIYHFFYCLPISIKEKALILIKEKMGKIPAILWYDEKGKITKIGFSEVGGRKLFLEEQLKLVKLGMMRYWNLLNKQRSKVLF